jgi:hypothetical protein
MDKKMDNVFMSRWSGFHAPIHSVAFVMDKQFCRREMDEGIKKNTWSVMEDFFRIIFMTLHYAYLCQTQLITLCVHHRFDDEVKDDAHGVFNPEMMKLPQTTWIETFVEGVTDKTPDCPYSRSLSGSRTRSLVSCTQCLHVNNVGLSRDGFTRKGGINSIRRWLRNSFAHTQTLC